MELSLLHDMAECIVGDLTPYCGVSKEEKHRREDEAMQTIRGLCEKQGERMYTLFRVSQWLNGRDPLSLSHPLVTHCRINLSKFVFYVKCPTPFYVAFIPMYVFYVSFDICL